jgi:predicted HD phosphohydrolase
MRAALERQGPLTAAELAPVAGVSTALVGALLKHDLHIGRVRFRNGRYEIHDVNPKLEAAIALVRSAGYMVTRGDAA